MACTSWQRHYERDIRPIADGGVYRVRLRARRGRQHERPRDARRHPSARSTRSRIVRFNFLYKEKGSGRPGPDAAAQGDDCGGRRARARGVDAGRVIIGGRSMGGRAASMLAADGFNCDGLLLSRIRSIHRGGRTTSRRAPAGDPRPGALLQRHARPVLHARPDEAGSRAVTAPGRCTGWRAPTTAFTSRRVRANRRPGDDRNG